MLLFILAIVSTLSTFLGGLFALRNRKQLHSILGFTAGVLLGVVAFDVLPEVFDIVHEDGIEPIFPMIALVVGFLFFHTLEKLAIIHHTHEAEYAAHDHPEVGVMSALALIGHSFADGIGIGLGFQVSTEIGVTVAIAVIAHDFSDGLNTVSLMLAHNNSDRKTRAFLLLDALAPLLGAASTLLFTLPKSILILYLGVFAGFLLYIGASDILPQAHSKRSSVSTIALTVIGAAFIFVVSRFSF